MTLTPSIFGLNFEVFLMLASGIFYTFCAIVLWKPFKSEGNELIGALFTFLVYQAISMFFMGLDMYTMNMFYANVASLAVFIGSTYMLKFPFSKYSEGTRKILFLLSLAAVLGLFVWFLQTEERQMILMNFTLWYDLLINGLVVGGFIIFLGVNSTENWLRIKAIGGGSGVVTCCVAANASMLVGAIAVSSVFQFLAPLLILGSLTFARRKQNQISQNKVA
jgi:hypothetical protein